MLEVSHTVLQLIESEEENVEATKKNKSELNDLLRFGELVIIQNIINKSVDFLRYHRSI